MRTTVAGVCDALIAVGEHRWETAWHRLEALLPELVNLAGSAAQREVFQETLLFCLVQDGRRHQARSLLDARLVRRRSPFDQHRRDTLDVLRDSRPGETPSAMSRGIANLSE